MRRPAFAMRRKARVGRKTVFLRHDFAHQRKAIAVHAAGRHAEDDIARDDIFAWQNLVAFDGADGKTGQIIIPA